ncbi:unnamed protein product [Rotaria socialis]|uniref:Uncharacterized protein n=1 Tax=Rotaria socialis TaxID=392032 RepID=A0A818KHM6_9BILA|nr:unnamed protein product [Rotaria socialis]
MFTDTGPRNNKRRPYNNTQRPRIDKTLDDDARVNNFQFSQLTSNMLRGASVSTNYDMSSIYSRAPMTKRVKPIRPSKTSEPTGLELVLILNDHEEEKGRRNFQTNDGKKEGAMMTSSIDIRYYFLLRSKEHEWHL